MITALVAACLLAPVLPGLNSSRAAASSKPTPAATVPLITYQGGDETGVTYFAFYVSGNTLKVRTTFFHSAAEAAAQAATASIPEIGTAGAVTINGRCVTVGPAMIGISHYALGMASCNGSAEQQWTRTPLGGLKTMSTLDSYHWFGNWEAGSTSNQGVAVLAPSEKPVGGLASHELKAKVDRVDSPNRTAHLSGSASRNAEIRVNDKTVANAQGSGTWSASVGDLSVGSNTLRVEQYLSGIRLDEVVLPAVVDAPPIESFTAAVVFDPDVTKLATIGGAVTAPGSTVRALNGTQQIGIDIIPNNGRWSLELPSSLGAGAHTLTIQRIVAGQVVESLSEPADYGAAVSIDPGKTGTGSVELKGSGADGAEVSLEVEGRTYEPTVANGRWVQPVNISVPTEQRAAVRQHARGDVVTSDSVAINAGAVSPVTPLAVTSPQKDGTYIPGLNVLAGRGTANATVSAKNVGPQGTWNVDLGQATVGASDTWSLPSRNWGPSNTYYVVVTETLPDGGTEQTQFVSAPATSDNRPVVITSIVEGETYRPGTNVLAGTGTKGARVSAENVGPGSTWSVPMGSARVQPNGQWELPSRYWGPTNDYWIRVTQVNPDKTTSVTTVHVLAPTFKPLFLVTPEVGDTYVNGTSTRFAGTSTPFATITVRSARSTDVYKVVEADRNGEWSFNRAWGPDHEYHLLIVAEAPAGNDALAEFVWDAQT